LSSVLMNASFRNQASYTVTLKTILFK